MGLMDFIRTELIDIIEWLQEDRETMVWRFPRHDNEIKNGAKLIVRESQVAILVSEGILTDVFNQPGTYTLETRNIPLLSTLKGWKYGFDSPFKAEVYFISTRIFTDRKWGTKNPIMMRDPEFGPVRLRAFGTFGIQVSDPSTLLKNVVGTDGRFTVEDIGQQMRDMLVSRFATVLGESKIPILDLAANYEQLGTFMRKRIEPDFEQFGLKVVALMVENISLPPEVEAVMDKRTSMGIVGNLNQYTQYQTATAIGDAANNPGGVAGTGAGLGAGIAMAQQMMQATTAGAAGANTSQQAPPPIPQHTSYHVVINRQQAGPFDVSKFPDLIAANQVNAQTLVWKAGMANWAAASSVPEIAQYFPPVPPPIPE